MVNTVVNYFDNLFCSMRPAIENFERVTRTVRCNVSDMNNSLLDKPFLAKEIRKAIQHLFD